MPEGRRPLVAGNWKMNGVRHSGAEVLAMIEHCEPALAARIDLLICPPATLVTQLAAEAEGSPIAIGGQDCHANASGAHTGDISAQMLADAGARYIIVGHSERRADHGESDAIIRTKTESVWWAGLTAIVCVGESQAQRQEGSAVAVVAEQVRQSVPDGANGTNLVVAYEPVWAIGTGLVPTVADVEEMHGDIRRVLTDRFGAEAQKVRILYGGSVKPENAPVLLRAADVDGALVGGASLKADDFLAIARTYL
ncbi:MAG: triose-phosphate isomerase [Rhizobiales bacterium 32-66-8]|nr:MAG: triose-phosphate isomerase [Rhizobiales bacterium 32-66-8]